MHILLSLNGYSADFRSKQILLSCCLFSDLGEGDWAVQCYLRGASCCCCRQHSVVHLSEYVLFVTWQVSGRRLCCNGDVLTFDGTLE